MRRLLVFLALGALVMGAGGCGATGRIHDEAGRSPGRAGPKGATGGTMPYLGDEDGEVEEGIPSFGFRDADDRRFTAYGHAPAGAVASTIARLVERFYASLDGRDWRRACSLMRFGLPAAIAAQYPPSARDLAPVGSRAPALARKGRHARRNCPAGMAFLSGRFASQMSARVTVVGVRVDGPHAYALVGSPTLRASFLTVYREPRGVWRLDTPFVLGFS